MRNLLKGNKVKLGALREGDESKIENWFNDTDFLRDYDIVPAVPLNKKGISELFNYYEAADRLLFSIRTVDSDEIIGLIGFDEIVWASGTAFVFIGIGDGRYRGKGYGREAFQLLLDYGFNELNFYKIQLNVIEYNTEAVSLYEQAGFIKEGLYREYVYRDGRRHHLLLYGLLKSEWKR